MASSKAYLNFILGQLDALEGLTYRAMMGEYILYHKEKIAAYICDDQLLVKILPSTLALLPNAPQVPPYEGAKPMLLVEEVDDTAFLTDLFNTMWEELPLPKPKKRKLTP